jgi:urease accessory protein
MTTSTDHRGSAAVGRHARLELRFASRDGRTVLGAQYAEPPLRAGRALPEGQGVHVVMASSAPGLFGGDVFEQHLALDGGACVRLTSQSAMQAHPDADGRTGHLRTRIDVGEGARLVCHWEPLIPFSGSRLDQRTRIQLAPSARLVWSEAFMSGRQGGGERWACASLSHDLRVERAGGPEYLERYRIEPSAGRVGAAWVAADCCYFGSTLLSGAAIGDDAAPALQRELAGRRGLRAAADRLSPSLLLVRLAATSGPDFHEARDIVLRVAIDAMAG